LYGVFGCGRRSGSFNSQSTALLDFYLLSIISERFFDLRTHLNIVVFNGIVPFLFIVEATDMVFGIILGHHVHLGLGNLCLIRNCGERKKNIRHPAHGMEDPKW
jgi:hypothetical protein